MADDTRETPSTTPPPPRAPANIMPGGTAHTAGGQRVDDQPSYVDVVRNLPKDYYFNFHKRPCVRDSQLTAISSGFVGYMVGAVIRKPVLICSNYAVATWCVTGCVHYQVCQYYRRKEKDGMKQAAELMEKKRATIEAKKEARRRQREEQERLAEAQRLEEERRKSWSYWVNKNVKFW
ncbi:hypothetical protein DPSP01_012932 [Paraphaeosphaeria sporulosa]|uniref:Cytochrome c oxidase assembly protein COX20, mitochondrial n=1 Tax=Paraphaeosphaeria sporulosa TaxID=1460663 RepID=A0A177BYP1_9PLEO|nr:uncharacterized protein CC84DRAFT_1169175 [Paraphaeosphaeria sporulosa]OAF99647.1 hypothetical protein CC84DRAFT_1169175 [Paraphaeosphaeria sporulosa]